MNRTLAAFFSVVIGLLYCQAGSFKYTPSSMGYEDKEVVTSYDNPYFTLSFSKGTGTVNPAYYTNGSALRLYGGNSIAVRANMGYIITKIIFSFSGDKTISADRPSFDGKTWVGEESNIVFSIETGSGHNKFSSIEVFYKESDGDIFFLESYYENLYGLCGAELKKAVKDAAGRNYVRVPYGTDNNGGRCTWQAFYTADTHMVDGVLCWWDIYSDNNVPATSFSSHGGLNIEHGVPNSWWGINDEQKKATDAYFDLFHLNPSDEEANTHKGNYPLGEISRITWSNAGNVTRIGTPVSGCGGGANYVFEPADCYKGDFARAFFYMFTTYDDITWRSSATDWMYDTSSDLLLQPWAYRMLLEWSANDPVDEKELNRNEAIYRYQGNRNPFIDYPVLARHIWGDLKSVPFDFEENPDIEQPSEPDQQIEITEDFTISNSGLPMGSNSKPNTARIYTSSTTGITYTIMGCYVNTYETPYYLLINGKNNEGAFISFSLDKDCSQIKVTTTAGCSTNSNSAINVYAGDRLIGKYKVNSQNFEYVIDIPESGQEAGTVYRIESATTSYNQQFSGFTYVCSDKGSLSNITNAETEDSEKVRVYNLQGFDLGIYCKDELNNLPKGIYIVKGKKLLIK